MSAKGLMILLTNYFPFFKGEEYIENEIDEASLHFDKILIIPTMATKQMSMTRRVPENVVVAPLALDYSVPGRIKMVGTKLPVTIKSGNMRTEMKKSLNLKQRAYSLYYYCRVEAVYSAIVQNEQYLALTERYPASDTVLYSYWLHVTASVAARLKQRFFKNQVLFLSRGHRYDLYDYAAPCGYIPDREYMLNAINRVFACSEDGAAFLRDFYKPYAGKIAVGRLGTLAHGAVSCGRTPVFTLVSCSAVRAVKRLDKIVDTLAILEQQGYRVKWFHLGDGDGLAATEQYAKKRLKPETCSFEGRIENARLFDWYRNHTVSCFVNLSDSEGVPVAIMEAMSFGVPVIATDAGGTKEIVLHGENGYVVRTSDPVQSIAAACMKMIALSEGDYQKMCAASVRIWNEKANAQQLYRDFYRDILQML